jgi:hypothetical protein
VSGQGPSVSQFIVDELALAERAKMPVDVVRGALEAGGAERRQFIVCGNHRDIEWWLLEQEMSPAVARRYIIRITGRHSVRGLRGIRGAWQVIRLRTFYWMTDRERAEIDRELAMLAQRNPEIEDGLNPLICRRPAGEETGDR